MNESTRAGRAIGVMLFGVMALSGVVNFVVEGPLFGSPGFLVNGAPHAQQVAVGALLGIVAEGLWLGIAITAWPVVSQRSRALAMWLVAIGTVLVAAAIVEAGSVMSLVSLSEAWTNATGAARDQLELLRTTVSAARNWPHFLSRIADGVMTFTLAVSLFRLALVPRLLAGFVAVGAVLQVIGVGMPLFGRPVNFTIVAPVGLGLIALALWLIVRGFRSPPAAT